MSNFIIERRANADSAWKATAHIIEAASANAALRKFGLRDAFASDTVNVCVGGKSGRQYRAVPQGDSVPVSAPVAALRRNVSAKVASGEATAITAIEAPYGFRKDGKPKAKPGRKGINGKVVDIGDGRKGQIVSAPKVTVRSNNGDKPVYTREMRLANLAKGRAIRAENIAKRNGKPSPVRKLNAQEQSAVELLARLDALQAEVARLGIL